MSFVDKLKAKTTEIKETAINIIPMVSDEVRQQRLDICNSCDKLRPATRTCKECGCFVNAKTRFESSECPLGKW